MVAAFERVYLTTRLGALAVADHHIGTGSGARFTAV